MKNLVSKNKHRRWTVLVMLVAICLSFIIDEALGANSSPQETQPISSRLAFLRAQRAAAASRLSQRAQQQTPKNDTTTTTTTTKATESPSVNNKGNTSVVDPQEVEALKPAINPQSQQQQAAPKITPTTSIQQHQNQSTNNRSTRTADVFQNGDGFNIFVTNTCERELMHVNIKTSRPFYGVIHTRNQRQKPICTIEANGDTEYNLDISHVLNQQDPAYCGVIRARKESPDDKDLLSVVLAVRVHRNIELSDDKFFLLNCTNRCRRPDCSPPPVRLTDGRLTNDDLAEREGAERETATGTDSNGARRSGEKKEEDECTIWKFPWLITLLWCMGILLLALFISQCIMCSSLVCRCVKTEVEEREPSVYEGASDLEDEDSLYNKKTHPMRIDYDNRDIYKTSNNYEPYTLDDDCRNEDTDRRNKSSTGNRRRNRSAR